MGAERAKRGPQVCNKTRGSMRGKGAINRLKGLTKGAIKLRGAIIGLREAMKGRREGTIKKLQRAVRRAVKGTGAIQVFDRLTSGP